MELLQQFIAAANDYLQTGFYMVIALQGLLIAAVATAMLAKWGRIFFIALGATLVHAIFDVMIPVLGRNAPIKLPPLVDVEYWRYLLALYIGYLIVISVFYVIKRVLLRRGAH